METLTKEEMIEINGGNPEAYNAGHAVGDFVQQVVRGVFMLTALFLIK